MRFKKKILLLVPAPTARGGITNYYYSLKAHLPNEVEFLIRGARNWPYRSNPLREFTRLIYDIAFFILRVMSFQFSLVQTSTSLGMMSVFRDGVFLKLGSLFGLKTIVFFRGWNPEIEKGISGWKLRMFRFFFFSVDHVIVLSSLVESKLREWGYNGSLSKETTLVDDTYISKFTMEHFVRKESDPIESILFLGRIEMSKGVFELLEAFKILRIKHPNVSLTFAGDGRDDEKLKAIVRDCELHNVHFSGFVENEEKSNVLLKADIYAFPSYTEGMPNSVLEAMAYGLPVYTRPVGGIPDIFQNGENGILESSLEPTIIAKHLIWMIEHPKEMSQMSRLNYLKAKENFWSSTVAERMMKIYEEVLRKVEITVP